MSAICFDMSGSDCAFDMAKALHMHRHDPPSREQLSDIPDTLRHNAALAHLAGKCSTIPGAEYTNSEHMASCSVHDLTQWVSAALPVADLGLVKTLLPRTDLHHEGAPSACASALVHILMRARVMKLVSKDAASRGNHFAVRVGEAEQHMAAEQLAKQLATSYCLAIEASQSLQLRGIMQEAYAVLDAMPAQFQHGVCDLFGDRADFVEMWVHTDHEALDEPQQSSALHDFTGQVRLGGSLWQRRLVLKLCCEWTDHNAAANMSALDERASRSLQDHVVEEAGSGAHKMPYNHLFRFCQKPLSEKLICVPLIGALKSCLAHMVTRSHMFGCALVAKNKSWVVRQGADASEARAQFVGHAIQELDKRGMGKYVRAAVSAFTSGIYKPCVPFGDNVHTGVLPQSIRERDLSDLHLQSGGNKRTMILLMCGHVATITRNLCIWSERSRANGTYGVYRDKATGAWCDCPCRTIAHEYVMASVALLDAMRAQPHAGAWWKEEYGHNSFNAAAMRCMSQLVSHVEHLLKTNRFLANGAGKLAKLQELAPGAQLPVQLCLCAKDQASLEDRLQSQQGLPSRSALSQPLCAEHPWLQESAMANAIATRCPEGSQVLYVPATEHTPEVTLLETDLHAMGVICRPASSRLQYALPRRRRHHGGIIVLKDGGWHTPSGQAQGSVYVEHIHTLAALPWPNADSLAAFHVHAYGPRGELWRAILVLTCDNLDVEGPHIRAAARAVYGEVHRIAYREAIQLPHKMLRTLPYISSGILPYGAELSEQAWRSLVALVQSGEDVPVMEPNAAQLKVTSHTYDVSSQLIAYRTSCGQTLTLPLSGWGSFAADPARLGGHLGTVHDAVCCDVADHAHARLRSSVRSYWAAVTVERVDEFFGDAPPAYGRLCPHDMGKRMVRTRAYAMFSCRCQEQGTVRLEFAELPLSNAVVRETWDGAASLLFERDDCFVYIMRNTDPEKEPLVVTAGLCMHPFVPGAVYSMVHEMWAHARQQTCPHPPSDMFEHTEEDTLRLEGVQTADVPATGAAMREWLDAERARLQAPSA